MEKVDFVVRSELAPFVNSIMVGESKDSSAHTNIPLYADGYPGIMFQQSQNGFYLLPKHKLLSEFFLYGQTLAPVSLDVKGPFTFIVFQLYPFASKYLLGVPPRELNDDCFDLLQLRHVDVSTYREKLVGTPRLEQRIEIISDMMLDLIAFHQLPPDDRVQRAIHLILARGGQLSISQLTEDLSITERTLERNFLAQVGLSPKQFAKIVQFQYSLRKLSRDTFDTLTAVGADSGFSDQSHFIRTFKRYTGHTPFYYLKHVATG